MAGGAGELPKWQAIANVVPNAITANIMPKEYFLFSIFFC